MHHPIARHAGTLVELIPDVEVVAMDPSLRGEGESQGVSRLASGSGIPFFSATFRGVAFDGDGGEGEISELVRVASPLARVLALNAGKDLTDRLEALGMRVLLAEGPMTLAVRAKL